MINPIAIQIGSISVHWYGVIMASAFLIGLLVAYQNAIKVGINPEHILNIVTLAIPAGIIGARIYYVIFEWEQYRHNLSEALAIWHGGLAIHGGLIGGVLVGYWYVRKHRLNFWQLGDILAPSIILGQSIGRWGNFINQEAHGGPVSKSFISHFPAFIQNQMFINGQYYHPTFLYESIWDFSVFIFLFIYLARKKFHGEILLLYLGLYSLGRFFVEGLRTDSLMLGNIRAAQLMSLILIIGSIVLYLYRKSKSAKDPA